MDIQAQDTRARFIKAVLRSKEANAKDFKGIQRVLTEAARAVLGVEVDFNRFEDTKKSKHAASNKELAAAYAYEKEQGHEPALSEIQDILNNKQPKDRYQQYLSAIAANPNPEVSQDFVSAQMGFDQDADVEDYVNALLGLCAPNVFDTVMESPLLCHT